jgi:hypothetical protein
LFRSLVLARRECIVHLPCGSRQRVNIKDPLLPQSYAITPSTTTSNTTNLEGNMATTNHNPCLVCTADSGDVVCELCESVSYCSDQCEAADLYVIFVRELATNEDVDKFHSMTHRQVCGFKQRSLNCQNLCAVCDKAFSATNAPPVACNSCFGIKYCSTQCQRDNQ